MSESTIVALTTASRRAWAPTRRVRQSTFVTSTGVKLGACETAPLLGRLFRLNASPEPTPGPFSYGVAKIAIELQDYQANDRIPLPAITPSPTMQARSRMMGSPDFCSIVTKANFRTLCFSMMNSRGLEMEQSELEHGLR